MVVNGTSNVVNYGTCSTAAATAAKVVSCSNFALITGAEITVKFTTANTAANPTLNVNDTGAKAIFYKDSAISAEYLAANKTYTFRYNGSQYDLVGDLTADSNFLPLSAGENKKLTGPLGLTENINYGASLPDQGFNGQLFFLESSEDESSKDDSVLPISSGGTGATTAADARVNIGAVNMVTKTITLSASNWSNDTQTVNVSGVTANNTIIVSYNPNSYEAYSDAAIRCIEQGNNTLTFSCENTPDVDVPANVVILN